MSYDPPLTSDLKKRFPEFASVATADLQTALDLAATKVDLSWLETDYFEAQLLYAAHVLTLDGKGSGREAKFAALGAAGISQIKIASLSLTLSNRREGVASPGGLTSTSYGQRFRSLLKLNAPAVAVANGST